MANFTKMGWAHRALLTCLFVSFGTAHADSGALYLPLVNRYATGTDLGGGHYGLDINGTFSVTNPTVGAAVPSTANYIAGNKGGTLTGLLIGQQTMANSLACVLPSDQSAIPVTGTFWQATQPISAASLPLPSGAATAANQSTEITSLATINTTLGTPFQAGGSIGNTSFGATQATAANLNATVVTTAGATIAKDSSLTTINTTLGSPFQAGGALGAGSAIIGKVGIDQTTPGTTNLVSIGTNGTVTAKLNDGAGTSVTVGQKAMTSSLPVVVASDQTTLPTKAPVNANGSGSAASATVSTVITLSAPANAVGFVLMNLDTSTANLRWAIGRTATTTLGQQLQPGRDTGFIPAGANVSLVAESGTQNYDIQWVSQ